MIKNSNFCCFNKFCSPMNYVKFTNKGHLVIKCIVQYTNIDETVTKEVNLTTSRYKRFNLPGTASNICLNILNFSAREKTLIYHESFQTLEQNFCYEVKGSAQNPVCNKTIC